MDTSIREEGMPLNWEMIAETVQKYWVQQVCVLVVAVFTWWYRRQTKKLKETASDDKAVRMAMVAYDELRRYHKRIIAGGTSTRVTEALLEMYWRENLSIDEVLRAYTDSRLGSDVEDAERVCDELTRSIREMLDTERQSTQDNAQLLRAASAFFAELEQSFCKKRCRRCDYAEIPCPAIQFSDYLQMLRSEMNEINR